MATRPSILGGPIGGEIDIRPPESPEFTVDPASALTRFSPLGGTYQAGRYIFDSDYRDTVDAAFRNENVVGSILTMPRLTGNYDPEFDLLKRTEEEGVLGSFDYFLTVRNEDDFRLRLERLRREQDDRRVLAESGTAGIESSLFAGILDLPTLIPGLGISRTAGRLGNALNVGAGAGAAAGAAETALQATQGERTGAESLFAVGGSVLLGSALGAGVGRAVPRATFNAVSGQIENLPAELERMNRALGGERRDLSAAATEGAADNTDTRFALRNEGVFQFMRKFPGGYLADFAESLGKPGLAVALEKIAPLAPFTRMDPLARAQLQRGQVGRRITADLAESVLQYRINEDGGVISTGGSVEAVTKYRTHAILNENLWAIQKGYAAHVKDGPVGTLGTLVAPLTGRYARLRGAEKLTPLQFRQEVGIAMFSSDTHPVKAVRDLAEQLRAKVFEPLRKDLVDVGFFDELPFKPKFGESYMTRRYRLDQIRQREPAVRARLVDEFLRNQQEARLRLRDAEIKGEPKVGSDEYIANMERHEIEDAVTSALRSIKGLNLGDSFLTVMNASPMHARVLDVPDQVLLDLGILETDIGVLTESYIRSVVPRVEMQRKFGNLTLEPQLKEMADDYARLGEDATSAARRKQLESEELARRQDIIGMRDRILGAYDLPANPDDIWTRAGKQARNLSYMQLLGMQVASAMPDISGVIRRAGLREFASGVVDMATKMPTFAKNSREAAELLNAIEVVGNTRARALAELDGRYMNTTAAERAIDGATGVFSHATGMTAWNMLWKSVANVMVMSRILKAADALVKGTATKAQKIALSENYINPDIAREMMEQFAKHGEKGNGLWYAHAAKWDPAETTKVAPPPEDGFVRLYHGGDTAGPGATLANSFTSNKEQALSYTKSGSEADLVYVDVRKDDDLVAYGAINDFKTTVEVKIHPDDYAVKPLVSQEQGGESAAFKAGQLAMSRESDIAVITPGQDKPLWFSTRLGQVFFQFKTFGVAANHRIVLSGLQAHDASVLTQFAALFALGAVVSNLRADISGRPRKTGNALLIDAIDRAGPFQIAFEANALAEIGGVGVAGLTGTELPSRFQGRSKLLGSAGPSVDMGVTFLETLRAARSEKGLTNRDVDKVARLFPGQNTPYALLFRNDIRQGIASVFGGDYEP